jgi:hypothetical protein
MANPAIYSSVIFLLLFALSTLLYRFKTWKMNIYLEKILYFDSQQYNPEDDIAIEYFGSTAELKESHKNDISQKESSRELKSDIVIENNELKLKENNNTDKELNNNEGQETLSNREISITNKQSENTTNVKYNNYTETSSKLNNNEIIHKGNTVKSISLRDYEELAQGELYFDKRNFITTLKDLLISEHALISLIFKRSLMDPSFIRLIKFVFEINMQFAFSAMLFTDDLIDARVNNKKAVI